MRLLQNPSLLLILLSLITASCGDNNRGSLPGIIRGTPPPSPNPIAVYDTHIQQCHSSLIPSTKPEMQLFKHNHSHTFKPNLNHNTSQEEKNIRRGCSTHTYLNSRNIPKDYCATAQSYTGATVTVSGSAAFKYLPTEEVRSSTNEILSTYLSETEATRPIRHAEIAVYDTRGTRIQCAHTDASGQFSFEIPQSSQAHSLVIYSRSYTTQAQTSVLKSSSPLVPHSISTRFTPSEDVALGSVEAGLTGSEPPGGAFFILDTTIKANTWLSSNTATCNRLCVHLQSLHSKTCHLFLEAQHIQPSPFGPRKPCGRWRKLLLASVPRSLYHRQ